MMCDVEGVRLSRDRQAEKLSDKMVLSFLIYDGRGVTVEM